MRSSLRGAVLLAGVLTVMFVSLGSARATTTRVRSLGGDGDHFEDLANVLRWYGCLPSYGNTAILELGEFESAAGDAPGGLAVDQGAGAHVALDAAGRWGILGVYLFRAQDEPTRPGAHILLYGRSCSRWQFGFMFGQSLSGHESVDAVVDDLQENDQTFLGLGARWELGPETLLDLAGDWRGTSFSYRDGWLDLDENRWRSFGLRARLFRSVSEAVMLVPTASYLRDDRAGFFGPEGTPGRLDAWTTRLGLAINLFPSGDVMGVGAVEWRRGEESRLSSQPSGDWTWYNGYFDTAVLRLALEGRLRPWLTLRGGAVSTNGWRGWRPAGNLGLTEEFDLTLGLGLHLGMLDADLLFNDAAPFNFGSLLTNAGRDEPSTFTSATLTYAF